MNEQAPSLDEHVAALREQGGRVTDVLLLAILDRLGDIVTLLDQLTAADQLIVSDVNSVVTALQQLEAAISAAQTAANNNPALQPVIDDLAKAHDTLTTALANAAQSTPPAPAPAPSPAPAPAPADGGTTPPPASEPPAAPAS